MRIYGQLDAVGSTLTMEDVLYTVSGIVEDIPPNTHFSFDMLMPMEAVSYLDQMGGLEFFTYYLIKEGVDQGPVLETIGKENSRTLTERFSSFEGSTFDSRLEALNELHLHTAVSNGRGSLPIVFNRPTFLAFAPIILCFIIILTHPSVVVFNGLLIRID